VGWNVQKRERYGLIEEDSENPRKRRGTFYIGPRHVKHHSTKEFVEFSCVTAPNFASEKDCRVFAQNSHVAVEIYDYYAKLFDPDYETVSVNDERFVVQYLFKEKPSEQWRDLDGYNPTIQVIPLEDGVEIKRILDTDYGAKTLEISYIVRTAAFLKHKIVFTNKTADTKTFRVVMKLAGITNTKLTHKDGTEEVTAQKSIAAKPFFFIGEDQQHLKLTEYLWSLGVVNEETGEWTATTLQDIVFDVHAEGCKADIIIGDYVLGEKESFLIDPDTDTFYVGGSYDDAYERGNGLFYLTDVAVLVSSNTDPGSVSYKCGGFRFVNVAIPQGSTVTAGKVSVYAYAESDPNLVIYGNDVDDAEDFNDNAHIISEVNRPRTSASVSWIAEDIGTGWKDKTGLEGIVEEIVGRGSWNSGNALALLFIANTDATKNSYFYSYDQGSQYAAKLEVTWSTGGEIYEINVDAVVKASVEKSLQTTYNIEKDAAVSSQAVEARQTAFNISEDAIAKVLADVNIEVISGIIEIFKDAVVQAQASISLESTFNINKDALAKASAMVSPETVFNVVKDAIVKASASPQVLRVIPINLDAVVKASATPSLQQTLGISKDAVVVTVSTPLIQSAFNISPEAIVKVLAEVDVTKEKPEVIRLFIVLGLQHSALVLGLSHATIDLSLETPYTVELEVN